MADASWLPEILTSEDNVFSCQSEITAFTFSWLNNLPFQSLIFSNGCCSHICVPHSSLRRLQDNFQTIFAQKYKSYWFYDLSRYFMHHFLWVFLKLIHLTFMVATKDRKFKVKTDTPSSAGLDCFMSETRMNNSYY